MRAEEKLTASVELEATIWTHSSGRTLRINSIGDFFLKNQGLSPIGSRAASIIVLASNREPQNRDLLAMCSPASCKDQIKTNAAEKKERRGGFENLVARYYRGVCTFASRLTDDPVEAVLLTHAAFTSTRKLLRTRDEVRLVTILLTAVMRAAQLAKLRGANWATRVHANKPVPEPKNRADRSQMFATVSDMFRGRLTLLGPDREFSRKQDSSPW